MVLSNKLTVILIALAIGSIYLLPHLTLSATTDKNLKYFPLTLSEKVYAGQVKEILEGHLTIGDAQLLEHKNTFAPLFPILPTWIMAAIVHLSGSIVSGFTVADFIFPAVLFLFLTGFVLSLKNNLSLAVFAAIATLTTYQLTTKLPPVTENLWQGFTNKLFVGPITEPLSFYRTPNPQITYIVLILALWSTFLLWTKPSVKHAALTTFFGLLLFVTYFYHVTYFIFVIGTLLLGALISKNYQKIKSLFLTALVLAIAGFIFSYFSNQPGFASFQTTAGRFEARYIDWLFTLRYGVIFVLTLLAFRKWKREVFSFFIALATAAILVMNFQVIFGWTIQPGHWPQTTIEPTMVIVGIITLFSFLEKSTFAKLLPVFSVILLIYAFVYQIRYIESNKNSGTIPKDAVNVLLWLDQNTNQGSVVGSLDINLQVFVPVLTEANIFYPIYYHYAPIDEIWQRLLLLYKFYQVPPGNLDLSRFLSAAVSLDQTYNINQYKHYPLNEYSLQIQEIVQNCHPVLCTKYNVVPRSVIDWANNTYESLDYQNNPFQIDYLIVSPFDQKTKASAPPGVKVFSSGDYSIYQLK